MLVPKLPKLNRRRNKSGLQYTCAYVCACACMRASAHVYVRECVYVCECACVYVCMCKCRRKHVCGCVRAYVCIVNYAHACLWRRVTNRSGAERAKINNNKHHFSPKNETESSRDPSHPARNWPGISDDGRMTAGTRHRHRHFAEERRHRVRWDHVHGGHWSLGCRHCTSKTARSLLVDVRGRFHRFAIVFRRKSLIPRHCARPTAAHEHNSRYNFLATRRRAVKITLWLLKKS